MEDEGEVIWHVDGRMSWVERRTSLCMRGGLATWMHACVLVPFGGSQAQDSGDVQGA